MAEPAAILLFPPSKSVIWRKIEAAIQDEAAKNRHIASGRIRFSTSHALDRVSGQLKHIPYPVLSEEVLRLSPLIDETVARVNQELQRAVYRDRVWNRRP